MQGSQSIVDFGVYNAVIPNKGPRTIPVNVDLTSINSVSLDLTLQMERSIMQPVQTIFIDNSSNSEEFSVTVSLVNQTVKCPPYSQGYFPLIAPAPVTLTFYSAGATSVPVQLINMPMPLGVWGTPNNTGGGIPVYDPNIAAIVTGNYARTMEMGLENDDDPQYRFLGSNLYTGAVTASVATIITANTRFFMTSAEVYLSGDATMAAPGALVATLRYGGVGGTIIAQGRAAVDGTATKINQSLIDLKGINFHSPGAGNLSLAISGTLTAGQVIYNIAGGATNIT